MNPFTEGHVPQSGYSLFQEAVASSWKPPILMKYLQVLCAGLFLSAAWCQADVTIEADGVYILTGNWMYWKEKNLLAPYGKFNRGEFDAIVFKEKANEFDGVKELNNTPATIKAHGKVNQGEQARKVLVITDIIEIDGQAAASPTPKK
ncbi:MAG: hypothetical protein BGO12_07960 [Verrucomicrobia bacterium 61-8]|nr:MAG: hypothetical protein BGO12_07960 [Verrucomicrobia bacterium 61-8]